MGLTYTHGFPVTLIFGASDCPGNATTQLKLQNGGTVYHVPDGFGLNVVFAHIQATKPIESGSTKLILERSGMTLEESPNVILHHLKQADCAEVGINRCMIPGVEELGVFVSNDLGFAPTNDFTVVLSCIILPVR